MKLHILGTGNGGALECYNTCFVVDNDGEYLLVDGGGGNQILKQLNLANIKVTQIHNIFLSHNHTDHILGIIWVIRDICHKMMKGLYNGCLNVYGSDESMKTLKTLLQMLFPLIKQFDDKVIFNVVEDRKNINIVNIDVTFFDIQARKEKQYGFILNDKLIFCGDEPLKENLFELAKGKEWMIHEGFCLDSEKDIFHVYQTGHCTVKEASITAQTVGVNNLIILHTEDNDLMNRKMLYTSESNKVFDGNVFVPNDLEVIEL